MTVASTVAAATAIPKTTPKVAVIGGGAAGLAAARILSRNNITPYVFEKDFQSGGVWRHVKHSKTRPMYEGLRTNLPREIMAYREKPWGSDGVERSYVTHREVLDYLREYEKEFELGRFVSYGTEVTQLTMDTTSVSSVSPKKLLGGRNDDDDDDDDDGGEEWPKIKLEWTKKQQQQSDDQKEEAPITSSYDSDIFDAVCVCNGHYAAPSIPYVRGLTEHFKGKIMHSVEYDDPSIFVNQNVLCIGGRASGSDLTREISVYAKRVYLSDTACPPVNDDDGGQPQTFGNVTWVPRTMAVEEDGTIRFDYGDDDGAIVAPKDIDTIIFCSGYDYQFPFINEQSHVELQCQPGERRVAPLYEQLWHARYPNLAFVGLQHSILPFPFFELQMEAIVAQFTGKSSSTTLLPSLEERLQCAANDAESGGPKKPGRVQDTHYLGAYQWEYNRKMAKLAGIYDDEMENYIATNKTIYAHAATARTSGFPGGPDTYRYNCYKRMEAERSYELFVVDGGGCTSEQTSSQKKTTDTTTHTKELCSK